MAKVYANEISYELHSLGWKAFQLLCSTIATEIFGQTIQTFFDSKDGGRDGAFNGVWSPTESERKSGSFTIQCKFTGKAGSVIRYADLADEASKAARLASKGLATNYFIMTNARLTGVNEEDIRQRFESISGIETCTVYGHERICRVIHESQKLRMLVPRIYGLGDLSQILDERAYAQATEILSSLGDDLNKFIITEAYRKSAEAIANHSFVLLLGEPMCGKSTIAAALSMGALDRWGCSTIKVRNADDFVTHFNPFEKQLFWVDDAFGATQLDWEATSGWNRSLSHLHAAISKGSKVIFTSRSYIYESAKGFLKESALPVIRESQVVIRVEKLTKEEKEQILYNHIRLGNQPQSFKKALKPHLESVSEHKNFSPEIARRLGNNMFTKGLTPNRWEIDTFISKPLDLLCEVIQTLDDASRSALALVFLRGGTLASPVKIDSHEEKDAIEKIGGSLADVTKSLNALNGSLLLNARTDGIHSWHFKHPTVQDAFAYLVATNQDLMDIYIAGASVDKLFMEVTCGDLKLRGTSVIIPENLYSRIIEKITKEMVSEKLNYSALYRFLSYRCDKSFLGTFLQAFPDFLDDLEITSLLTACTELDVILAFHQANLLPARERFRIVSIIRDFSVTIPDAGFLRDDIGQLLLDSERDEILDRVRRELIPNLSQSIESWRYDYRSHEDPETYFEELQGFLKAYKEVFKSDKLACERIDNGLSKIGTIIGELLEDYEQRDKSRLLTGESGPTEFSNLSRSIFDDVDS